jgi:hypothetical protein
VDFTLTYRGKLPSNGSPAEKHALRQAFHPQLGELWRHAPLKEFEAFTLRAAGSTDALHVPSSNKGFTHTIEHSLVLAIDVNT